MKYDIAIIGGGPAGLMAAGRAGELGARVVVLEKNHRPGVKLLATGGGRSNLTNFEDDPKELAKKYLPNGKFLISAFTRFGPKQLIDLFNRLGVKTKIESRGRVFPVSDRADEVLSALLKYVKNGGVTIRTEAAVEKIISTAGGRKIEKIVLEGGKEIVAENYLIATGGKTYPATGSTGDGYAWLTKLGHTVVRPMQGLAPIHFKEKIVKELAGLSLDNLKVTASTSDKKLAELSGEAIFSFSGLSGPLAHDLSNLIGRDIGGGVKLSLDFAPECSLKEFDQRLQKLLAENGGKTVKNCLHLLFPPKLITAILILANINPDLKAGSINREERQKMTSAVKSFVLSVKGLAGFDQAMITVGGVELKEIDQKTMKSKVVDNLYLAGEIIDLQGPTGGYNLQLCWSTGYLAGEAMAQAK